MGKKSLSDIEPPIGKRGLGKTQFLAQLEEIKLALKKGWTAKDIWLHLHNEKTITIQYVLFSRYVNKFINLENTANKITSINDTEQKKSDFENRQNNPRKAHTFATSKISNTVRPRNAKDVNDDEIY